MIAAPPNPGSAAGPKAGSVAAPSRSGCHSLEPAGPKAGSVAAPSRSDYHSLGSAGVAAAPLGADGTATVGDGVTHAAGGTPVQLGGAADPRLPPLLSSLFAVGKRKIQG